MLSIPKVGVRRIHVPLSNSLELSFSRFFTTIGVACVNAVWAIYMSSFGLSNSTIGFLSAGFVTVSIVVAFLSIPFLEYFNQSKILIVSMVSSAFAYFMIGFFHSLGVFIFMACFLSVSEILRIECYSILFRDSVTRKKLNEAEGFLYTLLNLAWLLGPLIAGFFILKFGVSSVFFLSIAFVFIGIFLLLLTRLPNFKAKRFEYDTHVVENVRDFLSYKKAHLPYIMAAGVQVWWVLVYLYVPLFMIKSGLSDSSVAIFIALVVAPLILIENLVGKLSSKYGFRFFFFTGFLALCILSLFLFLSNDIYIQLGLIIFASIFVSFLEPLQDTFFFKRTRVKDEDKFFPLFNTSLYAGAFFARVIFATVLLFLPSRFVYFFMFILMGIFASFARKIPRGCR